MKYVFDTDSFLRHLRVSEQYPIEEITPGLSLSERFNLIRKNYENYGKRVDAGDCSWMDINPYLMGDWLSILTPIEEAAWHDIRLSRLAFWPQLPVGRFFVDFGNPVVKIAIECDGKKWHDEEKDRLRDIELEGMGWIVFRVPGWRCNRVIEWPDNFDDLSEAKQHDIKRRRHLETMEGVMEEVKYEWECRLDLLKEFA